MAVTVYSKPACTQCDATYRQLSKGGLVKDVDYRVVDITQDPEALATIKARGFQQAPVVVTEDDAWSGFRPDKLKPFIAAYRASTESVAA